MIWLTEIKNDLPTGMCQPKEYQIEHNVPLDCYDVTFKIWGMHLMIRIPTNEIRTTNVQETSK